MLRPCACARRISHRAFSTINLPTPSGLNLQTNNLLGEVRDLSTRGQVKEALSLFYTLQPPPHCNQTYATLFHACARHHCIHEGLSLHHYMVAQKPINSPDLFVTNHLINMYAKFGYLEYANQLFDEMPRRNIVSWTALISGYAQRGETENCFRLFAGMLVHYQPNEFAFASVLSSCVKSDVGYGRQVHALALKMSLDACVYVANALITMYSKICNHGGVYDVSKDEAWNVFKSMEFRNLISWNSMIAGFQYRGLGAQAIHLFRQMYLDGNGFDRATLLSVLSSMCRSNDLDDNGVTKFCFQLHCLTIKAGFTLKIEVATALVKAYSDLGGDIADCYRLFSETSCHRDIVAWTGIITTFSEQDPEEALFLFRQLRQENLLPDRYTFSIVLKAYASLATERHALAVHSQVIKAGFEGDTVLANALIHAYARCGSIALSKQVFDGIEFYDVVSWNTMLKAYALYGQATEALQLFSQMDVKPDSATFVSLLCACSHAGLVEEGTQIFDSMLERYGIVPQLDHYACMVDILGRAGMIVEAEELVSRMPMEPDSVVWSALLGSCRKHGKTQLAKLAANRLKELAPEDSLGYVQMSNMYCSDGNFGEAGLVRKEMKGSRVKKEPGLSWIEIGNRVHEFSSGGRHHPERKVICSKLEELIVRLKEMGYVPDTSLSVHDVEEEHKEEQLYHHSEKLALVFAIMNEGSSNCSRTAIKIMKNIRICVDCHNFMKLASNLLHKEIFVRDSNRFHHFHDGICSCNDYW
ncbi:PREDICTED: pentatricopeptide repeat-containing protein At1g71420 [Prunus mume]|uniref:Pentatricopeptide repeat-containing protein At1g71420 n=1 Tax=Prunus mume TaxID=102107 RepID=A0ABM0PCU1_PRUMU|nr:PREDICTED: pentatricopeptide repeat-containing protein At1g71420 [Prunus mume]